MPDPVIVQYKDGAEYELASAAVARKAHPDAKIVRFAATGEPFKDGSKPTASAPEVEAFSPPPVLAEPEGKGKQ